MMAIEDEKAAALAARDLTLTVACPECKREAGQRCLSILGVPSNLVHKARHEAWKAAR
jgi:hypothetical protein